MKNICDQVLAFLLRYAYIVKARMYTIDNKHAKVIIGITFYLLKLGPEA